MLDIPVVMLNAVGLATLAFVPPRSDYLTGRTGRLSPGLLAGALGAPVPDALVAPRTSGPVGTGHLPARLRSACRAGRDRIATATSATANRPLDRYASRSRFPSVVAAVIAVLAKDCEVSCGPAADAGGVCLSEE